MERPIWTPSADRVKNSQMYDFMQSVNRKFSLQCKNYSQLWGWANQHPEEFWQEIWDYCGVVAEARSNKVLQNVDKMPGALWFEGARLNFAKNLLKIRSDKPALIFRNEQGQRRVLSYKELYLAVAQVASALKKMGIGINDRVVGYLPNMPETIIAMLATTSLGAIWSSCSPDFGVEGVYDRFGQIQPKALFTIDGYFYNGKPHSIVNNVESLANKITSLEKIIVFPYLGDTSSSLSRKAVFWNDFIDRSAAEIEFASLAFNHPLYILYSSGTTGMPKCIVHSAGGTLLQHLKELMLHTDLKAEDRFLYFTTCGWMMWNWMVSGLAVGATLIVYDGSPQYPKNDYLFDLIDEESISVFGTGAKYIAAIEKAGVFPGETHSLKSLKTILSTGSPLLQEHFSYVYQHIKSDLCLASISGGTDIVSCFALGNPLLPVYSGELQCRGLGMNVAVFDDQGNSILQQKGELVCTAPFPAMPIYFWNDPIGEKYYQAYFNKFPGVWAHGDYAEITMHDGMIIYGRSDAVLKPSGVRIGTAEIYRQVEQIDGVLESIAVGQDWQDTQRVILFVKLRNGIELTDELIKSIKTKIRENTSPFHVPAKVIQVKDIPRTISGKIVELAVREVIHDRPVKNIDSLANPESLQYFKNRVELQN